MAQLSFWPYITAKKTLGEATKCLEALILMIDMTINALPPCQVTYGDHLLYLKTQNCLLSMAKMAKLGFGPTLALCHNKIDPWRGHEMF